MSVEIATLGGGCFWCIEAIFQRVDGVSEVHGQVPFPDLYKLTERHNAPRRSARLRGSQPRA